MPDFSKKCKYVHISESLIDKKKQNEIYDLNYRVIEEIFMKLGVRVIWFEEFDDLPGLVAKVFKIPFNVAVPSKNEETSVE